MPTVDIGDNTGDDFAGTEDTELTLEDPTGNSGTADGFYASQFSAGTMRNAIIRFTGLSSISGPVTVNSATVSLSQDDSGNTPTVSARKLLRAWAEAQATWNIYSTGNNWGTAGGTNSSDRDSTVLGTRSTAPGYGTVSGAGMAGFFQDIINGSASNNGLHLECATGAGNYNHYRSSEFTDGSRPFATIDYTAGGGDTLMSQISM